MAGASNLRRTQPRGTARDPDRMSTHLNRERSDSPRNGACTTLTGAIVKGIVTIGAVIPEKTRHLGAEVIGLFHFFVMEL